jgi:hypothetical protein
MIPYLYLHVFASLWKLKIEHKVVDGKKPTDFAHCTFRDKVRPLGEHMLFQFAFFGDPPLRDCSVVVKVGQLQNTWHLLQVSHYFELFGNEPFVV